jgi:hypothetical protein
VRRRGVLRSPPDLPSWKFRIESGLGLAVSVCGTIGSGYEIESLKTYIQDAQSEGDQELVDFFNAVLENNLEAAQRAKEMLVPRFQSEQE